MKLSCHFYNRKITRPKQNAYNLTLFLTLWENPSKYIKAMQFVLWVQGFPKNISTGLEGLFNFKVGRYVNGTEVYYEEKNNLLLPNTFLTTLDKRQRIQKLVLIEKKALPTATDAKYHYIDDALDLQSSLGQ